MQNHLQHRRPGEPIANGRRGCRWRGIPFTRIVGNLGIYTKIDFKNREVVECKSTSSLFRGYSVFMRGKDPRDSHFITSRICGICGDNHATCSVLHAEHGVRHQDAAARRVDLQPRRGRRVHVRSLDLPGQPGGSSTSASRWCARPTPKLLEKAERTPAPTLCHPRQANDRGHHARVQPVHRRASIARRCK